MSSVRLLRITCRKIITYESGQVHWSADCLWTDGCRMHRGIYRFPFSEPINELLYSTSEGIVCNYEAIWECSYTWNCTGLLVVNLWITRSPLHGVQQDTKGLALQSRDWIFMDALPTNRTWPPSCRHGTYQHMAITSRSRQLLMVGTWLPETCWATIRREIKNTKSDI